MECGYARLRCIDPGAVERVMRSLEANSRSGVALAREPVFVFRFLHMTRCELLREKIERREVIFLSFIRPKGEWVSKILGKW